MSQVDRLGPDTQQAGILPQEHIALDGGAFVVPVGEGFGEFSFHLSFFCNPCSFSSSKNASHSSDSEGQ
jgi:hypothetical protein